MRASSGPPSFTGGIDGYSKAHIRYLDRKVADHGAADRTAYGQHRGSTRSYATHHTQQIVKAAVVGDAKAINRTQGKPSQDNGLQRAIGARCGHRRRLGGLSPPRRHVTLRRGPRGGPHRRVSGGVRLTVVPYENFFL